MAAVLAGPWTAVLCISKVLLVQGLFMADGGITALGTNITLMGLVGVGVGWLVFRGIRAVRPDKLCVVAPAEAVGALVSVPVAGHGHRLDYHGDSVVHRAPAHLKLVALVVLMLVVVATPRGWYAAFAGYLALLCTVVAVSGVPAGYLAKWMLIETPFALFAVAVPFIAEGPRVDVLGLSLSEPGLWAAWGLFAKGTLGALASLTLAATTDPQAVLVGLRRLRMPDLIVQIMGFMRRHLDVVSAEMGRMIMAMRSRGCDPRSPRHGPVLARSLGALFIRSYERGERVHLAMLARGYDGTSRAG